MNNSRVCIVLGLFNGAKYLQEQLDSIEAQLHRNWYLLITDDGSTDNSIKIINQFAKRCAENQVTIVNGPQRGFALNFISALSKVPDDADFVAFCDQDDVWLPKKLSVAVANLEECPPSSPAMICGRTFICDSNLNIATMSPLFRRPPSFQNALVQNIGGGNTMVLNKAAVHAVSKACSESEQLVAHDWTTYQVVTGVGGTVLYDREPFVLYRQHTHNQIGSNVSTYSRLVRIRRLLRGDYRIWFDTNAVAISKLKTNLTIENSRSFELFEKGRTASLPARLRSVRKSGVYRQTFLGTLGLWLSALLCLW